MTDLEKRITLTEKHYDSVVGASRAMCRALDNYLMSVTLERPSKERRLEELRKATEEVRRATAEMEKELCPEVTS